MPAGVDTTALRRSEPALMQWLDCLAASVQDEVAASCGYWEELRAALVATNIDMDDVDTTIPANKGAEGTVNMKRP